MDLRTALLALLLAACGGGGSAPATPAPGPGTGAAPVVAPTITAQPANQTITENSNATFSVAASGVGLSYQWQNSTDAGATWAKVDGPGFVSSVVPAGPRVFALADGKVQVSTDQGLTFANIVKSTVFLTDLANFAGMNEIYAKYFTENFPARSTIQVAGLPKAANVEIEVIAHF